MWDAATVEWPSQNVVEVKLPDGDRKITPSYANAYFGTGCGG